MLRYNLLVPSSTKRRKKSGEIFPVGAAVNAFMVLDTNVAGR